MSMSRSAKARFACLICPRSDLPIVTRFFSIRSSAGGSWPAIGISLAMLTHWSPIRSMFFITCKSAAIRRRSVATGAWVASSVRIAWWISR